MAEAVSGRADTAGADASAPFDREKVIAELDKAFGRLPEAEIREAREHRDVMVPWLIGAIQSAAAKVRAGEKVEGNAHFFALFLLAEFGAKEALPAILEAISLPGEGPFDLFGDAITSVLAGILVRLADDPMTLIDGLIHRQELNEYVRWEAAQAHVHLVRDGRLRREEAVERLRQHLRREMDQPGEHAIVGELICTLSDLAPKEAYADIKEAFERGLVDESMVGIDSIDESIKEGEEGVRRHLDRVRTFDDTIEELRTWASFRPETKTPERKRPPIPWPFPDKASPLQPSAFSSSADEPAEVGPVQPLVSKRIGRNESRAPAGVGRNTKNAAGRMREFLPIRQAGCGQSPALAGRRGLGLGWMGAGSWILKRCKQMS